MKSWLRRPFLVTGRLLWIGGLFALGAADFVCGCSFRSADARPVARAAWLQRTARRFLRVFALKPQIFGTIPSHGLLVCNHLGYLDILVLAAAAPAVFVAKSEVKSWPLFGWFASLGGTIFVHREKRTQAAKFADEIRSALERGALVILFPEGTSSGGQTVLPFKSALLEPVAGRSHPVFAGLLEYELEDGDVAEEVCYWKDMTLLPHLFNLLSKRTLRVTSRFAGVQKSSADRKQLARQLRAEVMRLKERPALRSVK